MTNSIDIRAVTPEVYSAMVTFDATAAGGLPSALAELVRLRASQLNGCSFCCHLHTKQALDGGEDPRRLADLPGWRESTLFDPAERAALDLTEHVTLLANGRVPAEAFDEAAAHFTDTELTHLLWTIAAINAWNRIACLTSWQRPPAT